MLLHPLRWTFMTGLLLLAAALLYPGAVCHASRQPQARDQREAVFSGKSIEIVDYGTYTADVTREKQDQAELKTHYLSDIRLLRMTDRVPAVIGTRFGIRFAVRGGTAGEAVPVRAKILYPGLRPPGAKEPLYVTEDDISVPSGETSFQGILLEFDWALVPGKWTFQLFFGDKLMAEKTFEVYKPGKDD